MLYLIVVTMLWAFSFSLIGVYLAGQVDPWFSVLMRVGLAALVFLPFLRLGELSKVFVTQLMAIGAVQLGLMYGFYYHSFLYLSVPEVLLFTVMTPVYITLINDVLERQFHLHFLVSALLAVLGAVAIRYQSIDAGFITGFLLVQGANVCFAMGQVSYKRVMNQQNQRHSQPIKQHQIFGWFFVGAFVVALLSYALFGNPSQLPQTSIQWGVLVYLGVIASGLGFFAWNKGATLVDVGTLAVMNNVLIPAGIVVNLMIWNRDADLVRLAVGGAMIALAFGVNQYQQSRLKQD
ncbi:DMT family transporter [Pseudoalteromonas ulvae]|uniref:EamA family transporter n=1 Tax=Pseudoalteromonas ulvae TaxID=107327 RepID=A0A244CTY5_PSEDV|nr:DMT family transporter [Pseudoalteromonas ulvae]OUL59090.1 EamA family transporter [Pseudoalteromonas ulvae]